SAEPGPFLRTSLRGFEEATREIVEHLAHALVQLGRLIRGARLLERLLEWAVDDLHHVAERRLFRAGADVLQRPFEHFSGAAWREIELELLANALKDLVARNHGNDAGRTPAATRRARGGFFLLAHAVILSRSRRRAKARAKKPTRTHAQFLHRRPKAK